MGWSIGWDSNWDRDIGYGVPAYCDHPDCNAEINRGLPYVCGGEPYGEPRGCGLYFCEKHLFMYEKLPQLCARCAPRRKKPFEPKPDHPYWIKFKLTDPSWKQWRKENSEWVKNTRASLRHARSRPRKRRGSSGRPGGWESARRYCPTIT
jgi:hypothetical protein